MIKNYLGNIEDTSIFKDLSVFINDINIRPELISELQINFGKNNKGLLIFLDNDNISEYAPLNNGLIEISYQDINDTVYKNLFYINTIETTRYKENSVRHIIKFESVEENILKNTFISKTFTNKSFTEMLLEIFNKIEIGCNFSINDNPDKKYEYFVFPKNISLYDLIQKQSMYDNFVIFFNKSGLNIVDRELLIPKNLEKGTLYSMNLDKRYPYLNILEYNAKIDNSNIQSATVVNINKFDNNNLSYSENIFSIEDFYSDEEINGFMGNNLKITDVFSSIGIRELDLLKSKKVLNNNKDYRDLLRSYQNVDIIVQGVNVEHLFTKVDIEVNRSKLINDKNKVFSGTYIITGYSDKFLVDKFFQLLHLESSDFPKGDEDVWK